MDFIATHIILLLSGLLCLFGGLFGIKNKKVYLIKAKTKEYKNNRSFWGVYNTVFMIFGIVILALSIIALISKIATVQNP